MEVDSLAEHGEAAQNDEALAREHTEFLKGLEEDTLGLPLYNGKHAGIGGCYRLRPDWLSCPQK